MAKALGVSADYLIGLSDIDGREPEVGDSARQRIGATAAMLDNLSLEYERRSPRLSAQRCRLVMPR